MGPELRGEPAKHQRTNPPAENHEYMEGAWGPRTAHQGQRAQHAPGEQPNRRQGDTPSHEQRDEKCGPDIDLSRLTVVANSIPRSPQSA